MRLYLAGPMRGIPNFNRAAFLDAVVHLRQQGHVVFSPHEIYRLIYPWRLEHIEAEGQDNAIDRRFLFSRGMSWLCEVAEGIALLRGWEASKGASAEFSVACALDLTVLSQQRDGEFTQI